MPVISGAPKFNASVRINKGSEITTPQRAQRQRGVSLEDPRPGLEVTPLRGATVEQSLPGAEVQTLDTGAQVVLLSALVLAHQQAAKDYFATDEWKEHAEQIAASGYDPSGIPSEITRLDAVIANAVARQGAIAMTTATLKELRHEDKKRSYRMARGRKNG